MNGDQIIRVLGWIVRAEEPVMPSLRHYPFRLVRLACMELGISIVVISVLAVLAISIYQVCREKAQVLQAVVSAPAMMARLDSHLYLAHTGTWPVDDLQSKTFDPVPDAVYYSAGIKDPAVTIEDGAVHLMLAKPFEGRRLSMRPATPEQDPLGPVVWFCSTPLKPEGWSVAGTDKTDIPKRFLQNQLR